MKLNILAFDLRCVRLHFTWWLQFSLSLSFPVRGGVTTPILSRKLHRRRESVDLGTVDLLTLGPCFPPSLIMCWALEDQLFTRFFSAVTVGIGGWVPASNAMSISRRQRRMASAQLSHRYALVPYPLMLPALAYVITARVGSEDWRVRVAVVPAISDAVLVQCQSYTGSGVVHRDRWLSLCIPTLGHLVSCCIAFQIRVCRNPLDANCILYTGGWKSGPDGTNVESHWQAGPWKGVKSATVSLWGLGWHGKCYSPVGQVLPAVQPDMLLPPPWTLTLHNLLDWRQPQVVVIERRWQSQLHCHHLQPLKRLSTDGCRLQEGRRWCEFQQQDGQMEVPCLVGGRQRRAKSGSQRNLSMVVDPRL